MDLEKIKKLVLSIKTKKQAIKEIKEEIKEFNVINAIEKEIVQLEKTLKSEVASIDLKQDQHTTPDFTLYKKKEIKFEILEPLKATPLLTKEVNTEKAKEYLEEMGEELFLKVYGIAVEKKVKVFIRKK